MDDEIEYIKRKKMVEYMRKIFEPKKVVKEKVEEEDVYKKVKPIFTKDAYEYLLFLKKNKSGIALKILNVIIYLVLNGLISIPIDKLTVEVLEKKAEGYSGKIYVEKKGELLDFSKAIKKDD